jgi:hypothetical protein
LPGEEGGQGGLQLGHHVGAFLAFEGRGRLGLARSLYRTSSWTLAEAKDT